jgi:hypothetical protein
VLDADWTTGKNFERVDSSVCAILIRPGAGGAVRVYSDPIKNVVTSDLAGTVMIPVKTGERCRVFGNPSVRFFHVSRLRILDQFVTHLHTEFECHIV